MSSQKLQIEIVIVENLIINLFVHLGREFEVEISNLVNMLIVFTNLGGCT